MNLDFAKKWYIFLWVLFGLNIGLGFMNIAVYAKTGDNLNVIILNIVAAGFVSWSISDMKRVIADMERANKPPPEDTE